MDIKQELEDRLSKYTKLKNEVKFIIEEELKNQNIKIHSLTSRIKTYESIKGKVERKDIINPFEELNDIVGVRVVVLLRSDLEKIEDLLCEHFDIVEKDNKIDNMETSSFGYMSNHFIVKLKDVYTGPRYNFIKDLVCEIQVRTIAMDAWATISHYLDYKTDHDVPKELKKDFYALSGLFYVADTHFEMFYNERGESKQKAEKNIHEDKDVEINLDTLSVYMKNKFPNRNHNTNSKDLSELVDELYSYGYNSLENLNRDIDLSFEVFLQYEKENPPGHDYETDRKFYDVGIIRGIIQLLASKRGTLNIRNKEYTKYIDLIKE